MNDQIADYLTRLKKIYLTVDESGLRQDIHRLDTLIKKLNDTKESTASPHSQKKRSFSVNLQLLLEKNYESLTGTKLNFQCLTNQEEVETYIEGHNKTKILKDATALDLKLLYSLLTDDRNEIKGTKNDVFEAIKRNIRARKRGEAFKKTSSSIT